MRRLLTGVIPDSHPGHMRLTLPLPFSTLSALLVLAGAACRPAPSNSDSASAPQPNFPEGHLTDSVRADTSELSADVELSTDKTHYRAGDPVTMTFINKSTATFAFNPCPRVIERPSGIYWVPVEEPPRMCTMEAWILKAHETRIAHTKLPDALSAGPVRIVVALTKEGQPSSASGVHAISQVLTIDS